MEFTIHCQPRPNQKVKALRRSGFIPVVLYGQKETESIPLVLDTKATQHLLQHSQVNNSLVTVKVDNLSLSVPAILREVQTNPANHNDVYHLSFLAVDGEQALSVTVPLKFIGKPQGVTNDNGILDIALSSLELSCVSGIIPEEITVDISEMKVNHTLHLQDLILPEGVTAQGTPERIIVSVVGG